MNEPSLSVADIRRAAAVLSDNVVRTPLAESRTLGAVTGARLFLKFENQQFTASFKERGALNKLAGLLPAERAVGVVAMSAGNHAQGVAYHARRLGIAATIVMPQDTPFIKVRHTMDFGAEVQLHGRTLAEASAFAHQLAADRAMTFVHPYDDPAVIAGQGTIALEMLEDAPDLDVLVVPVGGGGLISGMAIAAKALRPQIAVIGVQAQAFPAMYNARHGKNVAGADDTIAEGIAVREIGMLTQALIREYVDEIVLVEEGQLEQAVALLAMVEKTVTEGAGAAGLAAVLATPERFAGRRVGLVLCGGNIDQRLLATVLMRDLVRQGRLTRLRMPIADAPGQLARATTIIGEQGGNIVDVAHHRMFGQMPAKVATIDFLVETRDASQMDTIMDELRQAGFAPHLNAGG